VTKNQWHLPSKLVAAVMMFAIAPVLKWRLRCQGELDLTKAVKILQAELPWKVARQFHGVTVEQLDEIPSPKSVSN